MQESEETAARRRDMQAQQTEENQSFGRALSWHNGVRDDFAPRADELAQADREKIPRQRKHHNR